MTGMELAGLILGSAAIGALVSSAINSIAAYVMKRQDLLRQDEQLAVKLTEMKHQQLMAAQEWHIKQTGQTHSVDMWDPLVVSIHYIRGLREFRRTGEWKKGETAHPKGKSDAID